MSVPNSVIRILEGVPINSTYEHSLYFEDQSDQVDYFLGKTIKVYDKYTYLRPEHIIKVAGDVSNARSWNYLMFQNDTGKWYYHFINKVEYLNDNAVELHIELDVIQTFMFDWKMHPCFIERMHTPTDEFGEHTIPEGLETGPLIYKSVHEINMDDCCVVMLTTADVAGRTVPPHNYGGVFCGLQAYCFDIDNADNVDAWINTGTNSESIVSMWMYPKKLITVGKAWEYSSSAWSSSDKWSGLAWDVITESTKYIFEVKDINKTWVQTALDPIYEAGNNTIDGMGVYNMKTMCYPYTVLMVSNNMGGACTFHRERFADPDNITFNLYGALAPDSGVMLVPNNYKGSSGQIFEEALTLGGFPTCSWDSDTYKVWLAQNQNTLDHNIQQAKIQGVMGGLTALGSIATGIATSNPQSAIGGAIAGGTALYNSYSTVQGIMAQKADVALQPDQARGNHSGNINLTHGRMGFTLHWMTITEEYAKGIDQYFSRYGYKINRVQEPELRTRKLFTYIKTVGCFVTGALGSDDQVKIQNIFDKGITFWADPDVVGHFEYTNKTL